MLRACPAHVTNDKVSRARIYSGITEKEPTLPTLTTPKTMVANWVMGVGSVGSGGKKRGKATIYARAYI